MKAVLGVISGIVIVIFLGMGAMAVNLHYATARVEEIARAFTPGMTTDALVAAFSRPGRKS